MKSLLLAAILIFVMTENAWSQSCLWLDTVHVNPDSTYFDTCEASATFGQMFCRNEYTVRFDWYVISTPNYGYDTAIAYHWSDIDTQYAAIRAAFENLEDSVGPFTLTKRCAAVVDTGLRLSHSFIFRFDSLINVNAALILLSRIPNMDVRFNGMPRQNCSAEGLIPGVAWSSITLNGSNSLEGHTPFASYLHPLGWDWQIYKLKCPMAWEITRGKPSIHVIGLDDFDGPPSDNPDLAANFLQLVDNGTTPGPGQQNDGISSKPTSPLVDGHGHECLSQAVAAGVVSMIGTCPNCTGMAIYNGQADPPKPYEIDLGGNPDNGHTWVPGIALNYPEIEWCTSSGQAMGDFEEAIQDGMAVFSAGFNGFTYPEIPANSSAFIYPEVVPDFGNADFLPATSDPSKDVKPLSVQGTMDGIQTGPVGISPCVEGAPALIPPGLDGDLREPFIRCVGPEQFRPGFDVSCGLDKFSVLSGSEPSNTNISTTARIARIQKKTWAFVDVVAPGCLNLVAGVRGGAEANGYDLDGGTSMATPLVAGVAGLMRSVDYYVGATLNTSTPPTPNDPADIQRNINNIITFTADKIVDYDNNAYAPEGPPSANPQANTFPSDITNSVYTAPTPNLIGQVILDQAAHGETWQYNYVNQGSNDPLNRSWAQRVGFGRVNAYRAVANTITCKGNYSYSTSTDLTPAFAAGNCQNENSKYLMHFGAYKDATLTDLVLSVGGNKIPNQNLVSPYVAWLHYNQGKTLLTGTTPTVLTIGSADILAIDGLLEGDGNANHKIYSSSTGKILITGYLQDVEIDANATDIVKIDDLIVYSAGTYGYSNVHITSSSSNPTEIYGVVQLQDNGLLNVNGYLTIQPGGEIEMEGNKNFEISSGGYVKMNASTTIASTTKEVIVDNGATLEISGLLPVNVLCEIDVKSGGTLVIDDGADLQLNQFLIEQGGTFTCNPGGRLTLNLALYNYCYGNFNFVGISGDPRITLTGGVTTCGTVDQFAGIICVGNVASQGNAYMRMQYVDDSDVYMSGRDVPKDLFLNDYFSSSSALTTDFGDQYWYGPASLLYLNNSAVSIAEPAVRDAYLLYCRFFDQAVGATWHFFNGLNTYNLAGLYVNTSAFYNLSTGSETWNCPNASYYTNSFGTNVDPGSGSSVGPLQIGILDHSSGSLYCSNTISNCTLGISADHDMFGSLFDNTFAGYAKTEYCLSTQTSGHYMLRNNTFTAYPLYGIYSLGTGNEVILRDDGALEYGRNTMTSIRPFHSPASADLAKVNSGTFAVACGLNTFGAPSIFQILNLDVPIYSINVGGNNWLGLSPVREHNCLTSGTPLNEAGTSAPDCGSRDDASPPSCGIVCCAVPTDPNPPSAAWFTLDSSSSELRSAATSARGMMLSDTLDPVTRALEARTELWAASLTDSFSTYLPLVLNDYKALLLDPLATPELKSSVWMLKGQLNEMLGLQDSAAVCYDTVIANYHQFVDSVYALWDLQRLGIPDTETLSTDSGEYAFSQREYHDLLAMIDTISAPDTGWGAGKIADGHAEPEVASLQVTVHPNPVAGIVKICVEDLPGGVPVTVDVVNQMGQSVATLYNATPEAELGLCLSLDCSQLPSGIYYADLQTGGFHHAVKFSVEH